MRRFLYDVIDLALLRIKPLDQYVYAWQIPVLWVTLLGVVRAVIGPRFNQGLVPQVLFSVAFVWADVLLCSLFMGWWLRLDKRCSQKGSLFPLMSLLCSLNLILPLIQLFPSVMVLPAMLLLLFYAAAIQILGLSRSTGAGIGHTIAGALAFIPTQLMVLLVAAQIASGLGWVEQTKQTPDLGNFVDKVDSHSGAPANVHGTSAHPVR